MSEEDEVVVHLTNRLELGRELDDMIEEAQRAKEPLETLLGRVLPHIRERVVACHVAMTTLDESLEEKCFFDGDNSHKKSEISVDIDVAGEHLGVMLTSFSEDLGEKVRVQKTELLETAIEVVDNYLKTIKSSREKHFLNRKLHKDLLHPLVDEGIKLAVATLEEAVHFELMVVAYHQSDAYEESVRYLIFKDNRVAFDSDQRGPQEIDRIFAETKSVGGKGIPNTVKKSTQRFHQVRPGDLRDETETRKFLADLGFSNYVEFMLSAGLRDETVLGKVVVVGSRLLSTYERDLMATFADALQKRIIDFDRESRELNRTFNVPTVMRLLRAEEYRKKYLQPQRRDAAIMFTDISGFTRISEQVLKEPSKVGTFIQSWGEEVVRILWENDGACDKFVGDCLIGIFGPPFYDKDPAVLCANALRASIEIARFTREFSSTAAWKAISDEETDMGVATGINWCTASIGSFGLNCGYTAFSPGVNNSARLQGLAVRHEVLIMDSMYEVLKDTGDFVFGDKRSESVKNVKEPISFY
ncbi:MAG: adenylate/guanylate cyclase domain-containing protein, partial [Planctomycetota bacterium]|nr:adenylate/guanylate cyclase domain-containing protein [Planctomycetota bacterium]